MTSDDHDARCFHWRKQIDPHTWCVNGTIEVCEDGSCLVRPEASSVTVGEIGAAEARRIARVILGRSESGCPCTLTKRCSANCSCADSLLSGGCERCCLYGSLEQRRAAAEHLAPLEAERDAAVSALEAERKLRALAEIALEDTVEPGCHVCGRDGDEAPCVEHLCECCATQWRADIKRLESELAAEKEAHGVTRTHFTTMRQLDADSRARLESELAEAKARYDERDEELQKLDDLVAELGGERDQGPAAFLRASHANECAALARVRVLEAQWAKHEELCSVNQSDNDEPNEVDRLNPYRRQWRRQPLPTEPLPLFLHGLRYYAGMLEDDDNWAHGLGHIESLCRDFQEAITARGEGSALPAAPSAEWLFCECACHATPGITHAAACCEPPYDHGNGRGYVLARTQPTPSPSDDNPDTYVDDASAAWDGLPEAVQITLAKPSFVAGYNYRGVEDAIARQGAEPAPTSSASEDNIREAFADWSPVHLPEATDEPAQGGGEPGSWWYARHPDDERWEHGGSSRQEAISSALAFAKPGETMYVVLGIRPAVEDFARCYDSDDLLDTLTNYGAHNGMLGDDHELEFDDAKACEEEVRAAIARHLVRPRWWTCDGSQAEAVTKPEPASEPEAQRAVVVGSKWKRRKAVLDEPVEVTGFAWGGWIVTAETQHYPGAKHNPDYWHENHEWISNPPAESTGEKL